MENVLGRARRILDKVGKRAGSTRLGKQVKKVPAPIRKGWLAGALVPVPGAAEVGALAGTAKWGHDAVEKAVRKKTGKPYRLLFGRGEFLTPAKRLGVMEFMGVYGGGDPGKGSKASVKLDGVYARATKDGVFSKSGKRLDVPHVSARLKRHFRKHPAGELEGELWRKKMPVEEIAGAVRAGGEATKKLRLHVFPKDGEARPWPIGAVRRVKGRKVETEKDVEKVFRKALKRGHEGVVIRGPDGVPLKKKPREDSEYEVAEVRDQKSGGRKILTVTDGARTFKVQGRPGVAAKAGDRVQVSYSGKTRKGAPKAAVAERVRNDNDFEVNAEILKTEKLKKDMKTTTRFETPARSILGDTYARVTDLARGVSVEDELARDRKALKRVAVGSALAGGVVGAVVGVGRRRNPLRVRARKLVKEGLATKGEVFSNPAQKMGVIEFDEKRDGLSKARDAAIIGGTGAVGVGALVAGREVKKAGRKAAEVLERAGKASDAVRQVTPQAVAREGGKMMKKKLKEHFPTFAKVGRVMKRTVFETPAMRILEGGLLGARTEFAVATAPDRSKVRDGGGKWVDHYKVATGMDKGYTADGREAKVGMADPAVIKSLYRKANVVNKWGTRGGGLVKDAADVVAGKPRARDASGRKKKREWEKGWFKDTVKKGLLIGGGIGYGIAYKKSPKLQRVQGKVVGAVRRRADDVRDAISNFETPAQKILADDMLVVGNGNHEFGEKRKKGKDGSAAVAAGVTGAAVGGANGAVFGGISAAHSKPMDQYMDLLKEREAPGGGGVAVMRKSDPKPFKAKGKFGAAERVARARHEVLKRAERQVGKTMKRRAAIGGLGGAALLGGLSYAAAKASGKAETRDQKSEARGKRNFMTPARRMGVIEFDEIAADAGWDVRDPRGRSARVFAPGSRKRVRREKKWHEEVGNERKLWGAGVLGAGLLAGAAGVAVGRRMKLKPKVPKATEAIVPFPRKKSG